MPPCVTGDEKALYLDAVNVQQLTVMEKLLFVAYRDIAITFLLSFSFACPGAIFRTLLAVFIPNAADGAAILIAAAAYTSAYLQCVVKYD